MLHSLRFIKPPVMLSKEFISSLGSKGTGWIQMKRKRPFCCCFDYRLNPLPGQLNFIPMGKEGGISQ